MAARLHLRAGEVPALLGLDKNRSEWALWNALRDGEDMGPGEWGRWQSRLMVPIMQGIAEDHKLKVGGALDPSQSTCGSIMPPRCWSLAPSLATGGRPAVLIVTQRSESALREWKEPDQIPERALAQYRAVATAHGVDDVIVGVLVDGYSSRIFHIRTDEKARASLRARVDAFIASVVDGDEPEIDFGSDERAVRAGKAVAKTEASRESVEELIAERARLIADKAPIDANMKRIDARLRQIDTHLIHMAGADGRLEVGTKLVAVERDAKGTAKVTVVDKAPAALF